MNSLSLKILKGSQGLALFMVIFVMAFFLLFVTGGLIFSQLDLKKNSNLKLATQALEVADAGLQHALANIENPFGWNFNAQLNCVSPPCTIIPQTSFPSGSAFSYTVTAQNDPPDTISPGSPTNDTNNIIVLNSTAYGPSNTKKEVQAYVKRSLVSFIPPGALYLPASTATITFDNGTGFFITGNDTGYDGLSAPSPKPAITGVASINNTVRDGFKSALGSSRYSLVRGSGYIAAPIVSPSVITTAKVYDVNQIALNFYNHPNAVKFLDGLKTTSSSCPNPLPQPRPSPDPCILGTDASPQITYIRENSSDHIHLEGYVTGSGVLVVDGKSHIYGDFNFHGLLVTVNLGVTGGSENPLDDPDPMSMRNNAKVFGGVLRGPTNHPQKFDMRNNAKIYYSSQALTMVNSLCGSCLPQPARVFAWLDK